MELGLDGKVAFVTGATRGIGRAIALRLADEGCPSACARATRTRSRPPPASCARSAGRPTAWPPTSPTRPRSTAAVDEVAAELRGLDLVVANAGGAAGGPTLEDAAADDWQRTLALNVTHPAVLMRAALPHLRARGGGAAVLIASVSGMKPQPRAQYAAAKAAEIHLAHTLARELGPDGIRVNALSPGSILFEGGGWARRRDAEPEAFEAWVRREFPLGRLGTAEGGRRRGSLPALRARELDQRGERRRRRRAEPAGDGRVLVLRTRCGAARRKQHHRGERVSGGRGAAAPGALALGRSSIVGFLAI